MGLFYRHLLTTFACVLLCAACGSGANYDPIPVASQRWVQTPSELAVLTQEQAQSGLPGAVTFGAASGRSAIFLRFPPEWRARGVPLRAFLALEPRAGTAVEAEPVRVQAWRVRSAWQPSALHTWSDKPELAPPYVSALASSSPARTLRLDVTELARFLARNPELDQGIALIASGGSGRGASFATGMSGGVAPRLEVYSR